MKKTVIGMMIAAVILIVTALTLGGPELLLEAVAAGGELLISVFPILILAFLIAGQISELISEEMIYRWLGKGAGWKGPLIGTLAGALVPGGPFFFYPLIATLVVSGASSGTVISFILAKTLWSIGRIPLEIALVGAELTVIRLVLTLPFPVLIGMLVNTILPEYSDKIRNDVAELQKRKQEGDSRDD